MPRVIIETISQDFRRSKAMVDRAISEIDDAAFFRRCGSVSNPIALIIKHLAGNLSSRWSDFLGSDGDKPTRDRDGEFRLEAGDTRPSLLAAWERGWATLFAALDGLSDEDLDRTLTIRGEPHTALEALVRGMTHAAYHAGQVMYLVRMVKPDATWQTIPPGQSASHRAGYLKK